MSSRLQGWYLSLALVIAATGLGTAAAGVATLERGCLVGKGADGGRRCGSSESAPDVSSAVFRNIAATISPSHENFGVNIFGLSSFEDQASMITTLFQQGVRRFRVNNIGGWPDAAYNAINAEAGKLASAERDKVSVYVPSQYFAGGFDVATTRSKFAQWSSIPQWIIQLDACNPVDAGSPVHCANPTEMGLGALTTQAWLDAYLQQIKGAIAAFQGQAYDVAFVIPYQSAAQSPDDRLAQVKQATVDAFPQVRFTLERTEYPFWGGNGGTSTSFPFAAADSFDQFAKSRGFAGATFAESGWPRQCPSTSPHAPASQPHQCAYLRSALQGGYGGPGFVTYWWLMGALDVGDGCGSESWGLFSYCSQLPCTTPAPPPSNQAPALACPDAF